MMIYACLAVKYCLYKFLRLIDAVCNLCKQCRMSVKSCNLDLFISRYYNTLGSVNIFLCKLVFNTDLSVGLNFYIKSHLFGGFLYLLGSHKCMRDTCRTGCNGYNIFSFLIRLGAFFFRLFFWLLSRFYKVLKYTLYLFLCGRFVKSALHIRIHKCRRKCGQCLQMLVRPVCGSTNHKYMFCRLRVKALPLHTIITFCIYDHCFLKATCLGMRYGYSVSYTGC